MNAPPIRTVFVIPGLETGASMVFSRRQAASLEEQGVVIQRCSLQSRTAPRMLWSEFLRLRRCIHEHKADLVHAHFGTKTAFLCTRIRSVPVVVTYHGSDLNPCPSANRFHQWLSHRLSHAATRRAAAMICVSNELLGRLRHNRERAHVIPMGIDPHLFRPIPQLEARSVLGWSADRKVLLFNCGKEPKIKRLDLAEAAYDHAKRECPGLELEILRGGIDPEKIPIYLNAADALIVTSDFEGSPMIVKEALACRLPLVSVPVGDVPERIADDHMSAIAPRDPAALGKAIATIIRGSRRSLGDQIAERDFSEPVIADRVIAVYRTAIGSWRASKAR